MEHYHARNDGLPGKRHSHEDGDLSHIHTEYRMRNYLPNVRLRAVEYPGSDDPGESMISRAHPSHCTGDVDTCTASGVRHR